ncbi:MAG: c-type cytochrome [Stellaceae bacterium]
MVRHRIIACLFSLLLIPAAHAAGNTARGAQVFRVCAACHSAEPGRNLTGPSLAGVWGRKAGSLKSFDRYSPALKQSGVVWGAASLDAWLENPAAFIPHNAMTFPGLKDQTARANVIAYLKALSEGKAPAQTAQHGMGGMMGGAGERPNLKNVTPENTVTAIRYCRDTYRVAMADGKTKAFWESNLRFKTDSSDRGPREGVPVLLGAGMMGDRAFIVFANPEEFARFIRPGC